MPSDFFRRGRGRIPLPTGYGECPKNLKNIRMAPSTCKHPEGVDLGDLTPWGGVMVACRLRVPDPDNRKRPRIR
jgi:hypothetical protein